MRTQAGGHGTSRVLSASGVPIAMPGSGRQWWRRGSPSGDLAAVGAKEETRAEDSLRGSARYMHTWSYAYPESSLRAGPSTGAGGSSESENVNVIMTSLIAPDVRLGKI